MDGNWFTDILNMFFTFLDRIVYGLITFLYQLLLYLANLDLFGMSDLSDPDNVITNFSSRVYALLGIFMLFKISFSILQYMVNPDDFSDKSKGFGKMVTNVLTSLCLIVAVPYIFSLAFEAQGTILKSNFLGQLILGNTTTSGESTSEALKDMNLNEEMAEDLQFLVYGSFFSVDSSVTDKCSSGPVLGTKSMAQDEGCLNYLAERFESVGGENKLGDFFAAGGADSTARRFDAFGEVVNIKTEDNKYLFKYMPVISTVAGGFVVVMLLSFCFDVAVRIIKLGFLEIIAPIPIISYMDPKQSGKDGMLGRWGSECFKTYLSLFIRLAIIYFAFFVVDLVANQILVNPSDQIYLNESAAPTGLMAVFVQVMVILGVFMFAKEVPKLLERLIPGMQGAGDLNLNPLKNPVAAGAIGGVLGAGLSSAASGISAYKASRANDENRGTALKRALGGASGGAVRGLKDGITAKNLSEVGRRSMTNAGVAARNASIAPGTTAAGRTGARVRNLFGMPSKKEEFDRGIERREMVTKRVDNMKKHIEGELAKKSDAYKNIQSARERYRQLAAEGAISAADLTEFNNNAYNEEQKLISMYWKAGGITDTSGKLIMDEDKFLASDKATLVDEMKDAEIDISKVNMNDYSSIDKMKKEQELKIYETRNSDEYRDAVRYDQVVRSEQSQFHRNH